MQTTDFPDGPGERLGCAHPSAREGDVPIVRPAESSGLWAPVALAVVGAATAIGSAPDDEFPVLLPETDGRRALARFRHASQRFARRFRLNRLIRVPLLARTGVAIETSQPTRFHETDMKNLILRATLLGIVASASFSPTQAASLAATATAPAQMTSATACALTSSKAPAHEAPGLLADPSQGDRFIFSGP